MTLISLDNSSIPENNTSAIRIRETRCNTLVHPLNFGKADGYTANLYKGCTHGCIYCYAPSLTHDERKWGTYVDAKVNAPEVLERELRSLEKQQVFLSSASDPYQPVEAKYKLTRRCLEILDRYNFPVSILTRSPLVLRDLDLITKFGWIKVGMSITTVPVRQFEPGVPPLPRRIETLRRLAQEGIKTWVSLAPVIPGIILTDLESLFQELKDAGVRSVSFGILRFAGYEESKSMFEEAAGFTADEALSGREELVAKLSTLIEKFGMQADDTIMNWSSSPANFPLDNFF